MYKHVVKETLEIYLCYLQLNETMWTENASPGDTRLQAGCRWVFLRHLPIAISALGK